MPTVAVDDTRLYYEERGSGAPILLVHETGGSTGTLDALSQQLASSSRVISYDRRGFGRSEAPPPNEEKYLGRHADDAAGILHELGASRPTVFGWGMGAVVALALASRHPSSVARLVLYEPPLHSKKQLTVARARALGGAAMLEKIGRHRRAATRFYRFAFAYNDRGNAFDELDEKVRTSLLASARTVMAEVEAGTGEELSRAQLERIRCPIGVIVGTRSAKFLVAAAERCTQIFPAAQTVRLLGGDHVMNLRKPDALAHAVRGLL